MTKGFKSKKQNETSSQYSQRLVHVQPEKPPRIAQTAKKPNRRTPPPPSHQHPQNTELPTQYSYFPQIPKFPRERLRPLSQNCFSSSINLHQKYQASNISQKQSFNQSESTIISEDELNAVIELLLDGFPPDAYNSSILHLCVNKMFNLASEATQNKQYLQADKLFSVSQKCKDTIISQELSKCNESKSKDILNKQVESMDALRELNKKWIANFNEFEESTNHKLRLIQQRHQTELDQFENSIPDAVPSHYLKHSSTYLEMREKEENLASSGDYIGASMISKQADKLGKNEIEENTIAFQNEIKKKKNDLVKKHKNELHAFQELVASQRQILQVKKEKDMMGSLNRLNYFTTLLKGADKEQSLHTSNNQHKRSQSTRDITTFKLRPTSPNRLRTDLRHEFKSPSIIKKNPTTP